jgi:hypothetical protein
MQFALFLPKLDHVPQRKNYYSYTGQAVEVIRQLKGGLYKVKADDGHEFNVPKRHLCFLEE